MLTVIAIVTSAIALRGLAPTPAGALGGGCSSLAYPCYVEGVSHLGLKAYVAN